MKRFVTALLLAIAMMVPVASAQSHPAYGILVGHDDYSGLLNHLVTFDLDTEATPISDVIVYSNYTTAGAWVNGTYYIVGSEVGSDNVEHPTNLMVFDIENKTITNVAPVTGFNRFINDMTYDHKRNKVYAVARLSATDSSSFSALYTLDLATGRGTQIGENLGRRMATLACSYDGDLYGVDSMGKLVSIDPETGVATEIGDTGLLPSGRNTMEFDHSTGKLYWASKHLVMGETIAMEVSDLAIIDVTNGGAAIQKSLGSNAQFAALYIPFAAAFKGAPASVTELSVMADPQGANKATLSWTNPSKTFDGKNLVSISSVRIYRDDQKVAELAGMNPGEAASYTDNINGTSYANRTYKVVAVNGVGEGAPVESTVFVGHDVPQVVGSVTAVRAGDNGAIVSWNAPAAGEHGGFLSTPLTYSVKRLPDNVHVASGITETTCSDNSVVERGTYTYEVTAAGDAGNGPAAVSAPVTLGPEIALPYSCDFSASAFNTWSILDNNADGVTWIRERSSAFSRDLVRYAASQTLAADDYLILHPITFIKGSSYQLTFDHVAYASNVIEVVLLKNSNPANTVAVLGTEELGRHYSFAESTINFSVTESGEYNLAFHVTSAPASSNVMISSMSLREINSYNLAAKSVKGTSKPVAGKTARYTVAVENLGLLPAENFTVELIDGADNLLASAVEAGPLAPAESAEVTVTWNVPASCNATAIRGRVNWASDQLANDNITEPIAVEVQPVGSPDFLTIGVEEGHAGYHPFNLYDFKSVALNIYQASEIGENGGRISRLHWPYSSLYYAAEAVPVKIYLANTERTKATDGWIPAEELTLVYDGIVNLPKGTGTLDVTLDRPFEYTGGNLAVVTMNIMSNYVSAVNFPYYTSPVEGNSCYALYGNQIGADFDFTEEGMARTGTSVVSLTMQTSGRKLSGVISDESGQPIADATVSIAENGAEAVTDAEGRYAVGYLPAGEYHVSVKAFGYEVKTLTVNIAAEDVTENISLVKKTSHSVSGTVTDYAGQPVEGAKVVAAGYSTETTLTDANGAFTFENIVDCDMLTVTASKEWYSKASASMPFSADLALEPLKLGYLDYSPVNASAVVADQQGTVTWNAPAEPVLLSYDSGTVGSQIGFNDTEQGTYAIGTAFRQPMLLEKVSWQTRPEGGPHNAVHLYIYDLDENGEPTSTLLYSERAIRNQDNVMNEYTLKEALNAPRGCLVTLNYPGFIALAIDDKSPAAPYKEGTYYFTSDYNAGVFRTMDNVGLDANLMIHASGRPYPWNCDAETAGEDFAQAPDAQPEWRKYRVWRQNISSGENVAAETLLTAEDIADATFTDTAFGTLPTGIYRYKICAVHPDGSLSTPAFTNFLLSRMQANVTVSVTTDSYSGNAAGAVVSLVSNDGLHSYSATVAEGTPQVVFTDIWKGSYKLSASLFGFEKYEAEKDFSAEDTYNDESMVLHEIIATPSNLSAVDLGEGSYELRWNESGEIFDDFESYGDFEIHPAGYIPWSYIDGDGATTVGEQTYSYPGRQTPFAFICFNPYNTTPSMLPDITSAEPYSGNKVLASFWGVGGSDDYVISPKLTYFNDGRFSVMARRRSRSYLDTFRMGYSTTTAEPDAFVWSDEYTPEYDGWNKYAIDIPADVKYVAVNATSEDGFTLYLDDMKITSGSGMPMRVVESSPEVKYYVAVDGQTPMETEGNSIVLNGLTEGTHTAEITAVHNSGTSESASVVFGATGLDDIAAESEISLRPNPATEAVTLSADFTEATLFSAAGTALAHFDGNDGRTLNVSSLPRGLHLLAVTLPGGKTVTLRLILR